MAQSDRRAFLTCVATVAGTLPLAAMLRQAASRRPRRIGFLIGDEQSLIDAFTNELKGLGYAIFTVQEFVTDDTRLYKIPMNNLDGSPFVRNMWMIYKTDYTKNQILSGFINIVKQDKQ